VSARPSGRARRPATLSAAGGRPKGGQRAAKAAKGR